MTIVPLCMECRHLSRAGLKCAAFPEGIPSPILTMDHDHHKPYPGDHGVRFEPIGEYKPLRKVKEPPA